MRSAREKNGFFSNGSASSNSKKSRKKEKDAQKRQAEFDRLGNKLHGRLDEQLQSLEELRNNMQREIDAACQSSLGATTTVPASGGEQAPGMRS